MSVDDPVMPSVLWLVVVGSFAAFCFGFGTGANDVANAFGTSVGAKTLTLRQAMLIAAIFSFTGSLVLGRVSTSTISGGIADINAFRREPEIFAYGMVCALSVSGIWQIVASYYELNVSSTHSIIGSIIGFALTYAGNSAVRWQIKDPNSFPPYRGVVPIVVSWFFSPIFTAIAAALMFVIIRSTVLRRERSYFKAVWVLPPSLALTLFICIYFVFTRGAKKMLTENADDWTDDKAAWIAAVVAAAGTVVICAIAIPLLLWRMKKKFDASGKDVEAEAKADAAAAKKAEEAKQAELTVDVVADGGDAAGGTWKDKAKSAMDKTIQAIKYGTDYDIHAVVEEDELVNAIHANAEVFDPRAEFAFSYLQVFSACCVIFSHGAGEVGFFAGPLATTWGVYTEGRVSSSIVAPVWAVIIGALGLVIGLGTYGYKVTGSMGVKLTKLSPTRGFCAELATALVIMVATQYGLPTSSSQAITGGIIGVGLCEGRLGVNWRFFAKQFVAWVFTLFVAGLGTAALFAQGIYAPGKIQGEAQIYYEDQISLHVQTLLDNYRSTVESYRTAAVAGEIPGVTNSTINAMSATLRNASTQMRSLVGTTIQTAEPEDVMSYLQFALSIYQSDSILTFGQKTVKPRWVGCNNNVTADIRNGTLVGCPAPRLLPRNATIRQAWPPATTGRK